MDMKKRKWGKEEFAKNESRYVIEASVLGGMIAGCLMNSFECVMYMRMADMEKNKSVRDIYKEHGLKLFTKGLFTRVTMTCLYSVT